MSDAYTRIASIRNYWMAHDETARAEVRVSDLDAVLFENENLRDRCQEQADWIDAAVGKCATQRCSMREQEIRELTAERDALKQDAERYRWLRGDACKDHSVRWTQWEVRRWDAPIWTTDLRDGLLDCSIDAALAKECRDD